MIREKDIREDQVRIFIFKQADKQLVNCSNMVESVEWSGDEKTHSRKLDATIINTDNLNKRTRLLNYKVGDIIFLFYGFKEYFRGAILSINIDGSGKEQIVSHDNLIYLAKSQDTVLYKNINTLDIVKKQLEAVKLPIEKLDNIPYKVGKLLCEGTSRSEIIDRAFEEATLHTGQKYKLSSRYGKVTLTTRKNAAKSTISIEDLISSSKSLSIENMANQVKVTKGSLDSDSNNFVTITESDPKNVSLYGQFQHVVTAEEEATKDEMRKIAKQYLIENNVVSEEINIETIGYIHCTTGNKIIVKDNLTALSSEYYISSDSHTFSGGTHTMSLQLSRKLQ